MTAPTSVESQGPRPELPPTLVALDRARAAAAATSFRLLSWLSLSHDLDAIRAALWEREREFPATVRTTERGAVRLVREAIAALEAEHLSAEARASVLPLNSVRGAQGRVVGRSCPNSADRRPHGAVLK
jgi:hypothetical protein